MTHTPDVETDPATHAADCATATHAAEAAPAPARKNTGFASLISAAKAAAAKQGDQPRQSKLNLSAHSKKIGPAPNGSRRSMGKR
jgi:hypothetical protein